MIPDRNPSESERRDSCQNSPLPFNPRKLPILQRLALSALLAWCWQGKASDYEVKGVIRQTVFSKARGDRSTTNDFTVTVDDSAWSIRILSDDTKGTVTERTVASTNGVEIYDYLFHLHVPDRILLPRTNRANAPPPNLLPPMSTVIITTNGLPIGSDDGDIVGHLWLMYASSYYWPSVRTNRITPVYNYHAAAMVNPNLKVAATWTLLGGSNSLPREVTYLDDSGVPVGYYAISGADLVGETVIPRGFTFEEHRNPSDPSQGLVLHKRIDAEVVSMSAVARTNLIPVPTGRVQVIDMRLSGPIFGDLSNRPAGPIIGHPPSYLNPTPGKWPTIEEARKLIAAKQSK
jgi:hypothetical protein